MAGLTLVFARDALDVLCSLPPDAQNRLVAACDALAELARVARLIAPPMSASLLTSVTPDAVVTYQVLAGERVLHVVSLVPRR